MIPQARKDGLLIEEVGDELMVYDRDRDRIHSLNRTTALVWRHCDGRTSITEMATLLAKELGLPTDEDVVWLALEQLQKARLLREPYVSHTGGAWKNVSRREMIRRLGIAGAGALLLPIISSITAPTPAMAQYGGGGRPDAGGDAGGDQPGPDIVIDDRAGFDNCLDGCEDKFPNDAGGLNNCFGDCQSMFARR